MTSYGYSASNKSNYDRFKLDTKEIVERVPRYLENLNGANARPAGNAIFFAVGSFSTEVPQLYACSFRSIIRHRDGRKCFWTSLQALIESCFTRLFEGGSFPIS